MTQKFWTLNKLYLHFLEKSSVDKSRLFEFGSESVWDLFFVGSVLVVYIFSGYKIWIFWLYILYSDRLHLLLYLIMSIRILYYV